MSIVPQTAFSGESSHHGDGGNSSAIGPGHGGGGKMTTLVSMQVGVTSRMPSKLPHVVPNRDISMGESCRSAIRPDAKSSLSAPAGTDIVLPTAIHEYKYDAGSLSSQADQGRTPTSRGMKCSSNTISGRWTAAEHEAFLQGLKVYGREWKKVATCIPTRTSAQIRSHAQKYFAKVSKEQQQLVERRRTSLHDAIPSKLDESVLLGDRSMSQSFISTVDSIMKNPSEVETRVCKTLAFLRDRYRHLEDRLNQVQGLRPAPVQSESREPTLGPATAALALEQKSLRRAAEARHEMKKLDVQQGRKQSSSITTTRRETPYACVSLASMPSQGGFDSNDVIALSMLGGNLGRERIENKTISTIKDENSLKLVCDRLQLIESERPTKLRKVDNFDQL